MKKLLTTLMCFLMFFTIEANNALADNISTKLSGMIVLQVENKGEAWYINTTDQTRYYLGRQDDAFRIMRSIGLGIKHDLLLKYLKSSFPKNLSGKILLDVEENGEAYYVYPKDNKGYYLGRPVDAYQIMREKGLGISNKDLNKIEINKEYNNNDSSYAVNLAKNQKWEISLKLPQIDNETSLYHYITVIRDGENITSKTYDMDQDTKTLKESAIFEYTPSYSYKIDYLGLNEDQAVNYKSDTYLKLYSGWYDYPALMVGHNSISYYIPLDITDKQITATKEGYSEYGKTKNYSDEITAEITSITKSNSISSCQIKAQTKYNGKFYYTKESSKYKYLEYFICFDNESNAQKSGYSKSLAD